MAPWVLGMSQNGNLLADGGPGIGNPSVLEPFFLMGSMASGDGSRLALACCLYIHILSDIQIYSIQYT